MEIPKSSPYSPTSPRESFPRGLLVAALLVVILWGLGAARPFWTPVWPSALHASLMNSLVRALARRKVPQWIAVTLSALLRILPLAVVLSFLIVEIQSLIQDFPAIHHALNQALARLS